VWTSYGLAGNETQNTGLRTSSMEVKDPKNGKIKANVLKYPNPKLRWPSALSPRAYTFVLGVVWAIYRPPVLFSSSHIPVYLALFAKFSKPTRVYQDAMTGCSIVNLKIGSYQRSYDVCQEQRWGVRWCRAHITGRCALVAFRECSSMRDDASLMNRNRGCVPAAIDLNDNIGLLTTLLLPIIRNKADATCYRLLCPTRGDQSRYDALSVGVGKETKQRVVPIGNKRQSLHSTWPRKCHLIYADSPTKSSWRSYACLPSRTSYP
jgi:hypothetical protein